MRPKKILCLGQPDPTYRNQPTLDFFTKNTVCVFLLGIYRTQTFRKKNLVMGGNSRSSTTLQKRLQALKTALYMY